jgi:hypothetical protein
LHEVCLGDAEVLERRAQLAVVEHRHLEGALDGQRLGHELGDAGPHAGAALGVLLLGDRVRHADALLDQLADVTPRLRRLHRRAREQRRRQDHPSNSSGASGMACRHGLRRRLHVAPWRGRAWPRRCGDL